MCYHLSLIQNLKYLQQRFGADFEDPEAYEPAYHKAAFTSPKHAVITDEDPKHIKMVEWGLVPRWVKDIETANRIQKGTINAKAETIFKLPSFRKSIHDRRCLVLADGFFEWHTLDSRKYPFYIRLKTKEAFAMAGIWEMWKASGTDRRTFSIITTEANPMLAKIHNFKKRMPVILHREDEKRWLEKGLKEEEIRAFLKPYDDQEMEAHPVSKRISSIDHKDGPETIAPVEYKELKEAQHTWFY